MEIGREKSTIVDFFQVCCLIFLNVNDNRPKKAGENIDRNVKINATKLTALFPWQIIHYHSRNSKGNNIALVYGD